MPKIVFLIVSSTTTSYFNVLHWAMTAQNQAHKDLYIKCKKIFERNEPQSIKCAKKDNFVCPVIIRGLFHS